MARLYVFVYPFAMKYVLILAAVVLMVRIDVVMRFFDKQVAKFQTKAPEIQSTEIAPSTKLVPMGEDLSLKRSPRRMFFNMLNDFRNVPDENFKHKAIEILRSNPTMFTDKLDKELESTIYRWRDLLTQKDPEAFSFIMEIMKSLKGENLEMMKRFLSFSIDADMMDFLTKYSKSSDTNCILMGYLGDNLPENEKFNELNERLTELEGLLSQEKFPVDLKAYGQRCQMVLKLQLDKLKAALAPVAQPPQAEPQITPPPAPAPDPQSIPGTSP